MGAEEREAKSALAPPAQQAGGVGALPARGEPQPALGTTLLPAAAEAASALAPSAQQAGGATALLARGGPQPAMGTTLLPPAAEARLALAPSTQQAGGAGALLGGAGGATQQGSGPPPALRVASTSAALPAAAAAKFAFAPPAQQAAVAGTLLAGAADEAGKPSSDLGGALLPLAPEGKLARLTQADKPPPDLGDLGGPLLPLAPEGKLARLTQADKPPPDLGDLGGPLLPIAAEATLARAPPVQHTPPPDLGDLGLTRRRHTLPPDLGDLGGPLLPLAPEATWPDNGRMLTHDDVASPGPPSPAPRTPSVSSEWSARRRRREEELPSSVRRPDCEISIGFTSRCHPAMVSSRDGAAHAHPWDAGKTRMVSLPRTDTPHYQDSADPAFSGTPPAKVTVVAATAAVAWAAVMAEGVSVEAATAAEVTEAAGTAVAGRVAARPPARPPAPAQTGGLGLTPNPLTPVCAGGGGRAGLRVNPGGSTPNPLTPVCAGGGNRVNPNSDADAQFLAVRLAVQREMDEAQLRYKRLKAEERQQRPRRRKG